MSGAPPHRGLQYRRSSYAQVVSGGALTTDGTSSTSNYIPLSDNPRNPSRGLDLDGHQRGPTKLGFGNGTNLDWNSDEHRTMHFFMPSYLVGSRFADQAEASYKARMAAAREAQAQQNANGTRNENEPLSTSSSGVNLHKMVPSHRGMTHDIIERAPPPFLSDDAGVQLPTRWNDKDKLAGLEIMGDGSEVRFGSHGIGKTTHDEAAAVRADHPMPRQCGVYYYEISVLSKSREGFIGIGFSTSKVPLNRLPGWEPESWAYHGDDGLSFCSTSSGKTYGPKFTSHDVVGCGVNFRTGAAFFTKNGKNLGAAFTINNKDTLYPAVGMKKPGEHIRVNFGQHPFVFDIDKYVQSERTTIQERIFNTNTDSLRPNLDEPSLADELIAQFLAHDGYVDTARAFRKDILAELQHLSGTGIARNVPEPVEDTDAVNRQKIRTAILAGDIDHALKLTKIHYPKVLKENENIYFKLRCRKFIEMIRRCTDLKSTTSLSKPMLHASNGQHSSAITDSDSETDSDSHMDLDRPYNPMNATPAESTTSLGGNGRMDADSMDTSIPDEAGAKYAALLAETIQYGQELKQEFSGDPRREVKKALEDTFALIGYQDARESNLAPLLEIEGRVPVAEELNAAILLSLGKPAYAALERIAQQTEVLLSDLAEDGGPGAFVNVHKDFLRR